MQNLVFLPRTDGFGVGLWETIRKRVGGMDFRARSSFKIRDGKRVKF